MPLCTKSSFIQYAKTAGLIALLYTFSIGLTFYNKRYITIFPIPLSITMLHLLVKFLLSALWRLCQSRCSSVCKGEPVTLDWRTYIKRIAPTGIASALDIGFSNWSFEFISVSLYTMTKSTSIVFVLFFAVLLGLERKRWSAIVIVALIAGGLFMFTFRSTSFNLGGFLLVLFAAFVSGLRWTFSQLILSANDGTNAHGSHRPAGMVSPVDLCYHVQPVMILTLLPLSSVFEGVALVTNDDLVLADSLATISSNFGLLMFGAFLAFALELTEYLVVSWTSSITLSVAGIVKEVATLGLAAIIHGDLHSLAPLNALGLVLCILGISLHVFVKARSETQAAPNTPPPPSAGGKKRKKRAAKSNVVRYSELRDSESDSYEADSSVAGSDVERRTANTRIELPTRLAAVAVKIPNAASSSSLSSQSESGHVPARNNKSRSSSAWVS